MAKVGLLHAILSSAVPASDKKFKRMTSENSLFSLHLATSLYASCRLLCTTCTPTLRVFIVSGRFSCRTYRAHAVDPTSQRSKHCPIYPQPSKIASLSPRSSLPARLLLRQLSCSTTMTVIMPSTPVRTTLSPLTEMHLHLISQHFQAELKSGPGRYPNFVDSVPLRRGHRDCNGIVLTGYRMYLLN